MQDKRKDIIAIIQIIVVLWVAMVVLSFVSGIIGAFLNVNITPFVMPLFFVVFIIVFVMIIRRLLPWRNSALKPDANGGNMAQSTTKTQTVPRAGALESGDCHRYEQSSCRPQDLGCMEDSINGVIWRWKPQRRKVMILGAYCSKCQTQLTPVKTAESWQADLKCVGCGKTFVSMSGDLDNGKVRTFAQTQKLAGQIITSRHEGHLL